MSLGRSEISDEDVLLTSQYVTDFSFVILVIVTERFGS